MAHRFASKALTLAWFLWVSGCFTDCGRDAAPTAPGPANPDTLHVNPDTLHAKKDLARLAGALSRIPMPMGTRYFVAHTSKIAAVRNCREELDVFAIPDNPRGILGIDTVSYTDSLGLAHCLHQEPTLAELHSRHLFDPACGEAWERIRIDITPDDLMPGYRSHGTGRIRLISGLEAEIEDYEVDMSMDNSTGSPIFRNAHLTLVVSDGHTLRLVLVKPSPFAAPDFFPVWENAPRGNPVMAGPVLAGADTVGKAVLYGDRTLVFMDKDGRPVTPE